MRPACEWVLLGIKICWDAVWGDEPGGASRAKKAEGLEGRGEGEDAKKGIENGHWVFNGAGLEKQSGEVVEGLIRRGTSLSFTCM